MRAVIMIFSATVALAGCEASHRLNRVRADPYPVGPGEYRVTVDDSDTMPFNENDDFPRWVDYEVKKRGICQSGGEIIDRKVETVHYTFEDSRRIHYTVRCR